ncbi:hypothetical protein [Ekhidna sp.]|uniref:hypothetical protein n=1 Tax=Ekhidna sp. TaxID=2608089 RepID=UPI003B50D9E2
MYVFAILISCFFQEANFELFTETGDRIASSVENDGKGIYLINSSRYLQIAYSSGLKIESVETTQIRDGVRIGSIKTSAKIGMKYFNENLKAGDELVIEIILTSESDGDDSVIFNLDVKK